MFRLAMVLLVIEIVAVLVLLMPRTGWTVVAVAPVLTLILLAVVVLPIVLLLIVSVEPDVVEIPWNPWLIVLAPKLIEPIVLFEMFETVLGASQKIPDEIDPELTTTEIVTEPLPVPDPIVLPVTLPILAFPEVR